ncbi:MAG: InlB B-repeat-containing protein [Treponema lecithinolyticum]|uniref:InlB B-repeat-containing protein n=1 Tax=Treponema lecithinolyticum TaxID=53418 RepID=UPI003FA22B93
MTKFKTQKSKIFAFWGAAFVLFIAVFTGCPQTADGGNTNGAEKPEIKPKHNVSFSVDGAGGTLKAKADGVTETGTSPVTVEQDKIATFTAVPAAYYKVKEWKVDDTVISNTSNTYTHSVTKAVDVKVSFQQLPPGKIELTLSQLTIKVKAETADGNPIKVEGCTETELASGTETELHTQGTIVILKGKITMLYCGHNRLTALNVQGCPALLWLDCSYNWLTALDVQGLSSLIGLNCGTNKLTALDIQGLNTLQSLSCDYNQLTTLNVQGLKSLMGLNCMHNQLTALDVQGLSSLQGMYCGMNQLTALDVQSLSALYVLSCDSNQLTDLNVQGLSTLNKLYCYANRLTDLNVQGCLSLKELYCDRNRLNAQAFTKIFNDLPQRNTSDGAKCGLCVEYTGVVEGNYKDFTSASAPQNLKDAFQNAKTVKNWKMYKLNTSWEEE